MRIRAPGTEFRMTRCLLIAAALAACRPAPGGAALFDTTSTQAMLPDSVPLESYRDTVLGIALLRPRGLHFLRINRTCADTFPPPRGHSDWDAGGGPMVAAAWTRAPLKVIADDNLIVDTPEGWVSYGRGSFPNPVDLSVGSRWQLLSGSRDVGVPLEGGGMATDSRLVKVAVVEREDGCRLALTSNFDGADVTDAVAAWQMLESVRFLDRQGNPVAARSWLDTVPPSQRVGIARGVSSDGACLSIANDSVRPGTAVTMVEFTSTQRIVSYGTIGVGPRFECAAATPEPNVAIHRVEVLRSRFGSVTVAIAVLGVVPLDTSDNALRSDVDGDGVTERFGMCSSADGKTSWAWLVAETTPPEVTWQHRWTDSERSWSACTAGVRALLR